MNKIISLLILMFFINSCSNSNSKNDANEELIALRSELTNLKKLVAVSEGDANKQIATFFTFQENNAEEAMNFYISLFENSRVVDVQRYGKDGPAKEGTILMATFELNGSKFACSDSYIKHEWTFTPGVSVFVECSSTIEIENLFAKLSDGGTILMPLDNYGWSSKFAFVEDRFGVSWQLNLK